MVSNKKTKHEPIGQDQKIGKNINIDRKNNTTGKQNNQFSQNKFKHITLGKNNNIKRITVKIRSDTPKGQSKKTKKNNPHTNNKIIDNKKKKNPLKLSVRDMISVAKTTIIDKADLINMKFKGMSDEEIIDHILSKIEKLNIEKKNLEKKRKMVDEFKLLEDTFGFDMIKNNIMTAKENINDQLKKLDFRIENLKNDVDNYSKRNKK